MSWIERRNQDIQKKSVSEDKTIREQERQIAKDSEYYGIIEVLNKLEIPQLLSDVLRERWRYGNLEKSDYFSPSSGQIKLPSDISLQYEHSPVVVSHQETRYESNGEDSDFYTDEHDEVETPVHKLGVRAVLGADKNTSYLRGGWGGSLSGNMRYEHTADKPHLELYSQIPQLYYAPSVDFSYAMNLTEIKNAGIPPKKIYDLSDISHVQEQVMDYFFADIKRREKLGAFPPTLLTNE